MLRVVVRHCDNAATLSAYQDFAPFDLHLLLVQNPQERVFCGLGE